MREANSKIGGIVMAYEQQAFDDEFSRTRKKSRSSTIEYEIRMLRFTLEWLRRLGPDHQPEDEMFAVLESFLLHYRNLASFLSGKGGKRGDLMIHTPKRWTNQQIPPEKLDQIKELATEVYDKYSKKISTYLAHCTEARFLQAIRWRPGRMYQDIAEAIHEFEELLGEQPPTRTPSVVHYMLGNDDYGTATKTK